MSAKLLFTISSLFYLAYGIGGVIVPNTFLGFFGFTSDPTLVLIARFGASASIALAAILWLGRNLTDWRSVQPIAVGVFVAFALSVFISLAGTISEVMGPLGWVSAVSNALLALAFGYLVFVKKAP